MADLVLNHLLAQGTYSCGEDFVYGGIVRGFDTLDLKECPEAIGQWQQLMAGADSFFSTAFANPAGGPAPPPD